MIADKPWYVMARETGVGVGSFLAGTALVIGMLRCYGDWDDRRLAVRFVPDTLQAIYPVAVDTGGVCRIVFWPQQPRRVR